MYKRNDPRLFLLLLVALAVASCWRWYWWWASLRDLRDLGHLGVILYPDVYAVAPMPSTVHPFPPLLSQGSVEFGSVALVSEKRNKKERKKRGVNKDSVPPVEERNTRYLCVLGFVYVLMLCASLFLCFPPGNVV